jgi:L-ascorbate metabolism protein UlaG (beta-lactamase superfamily)
MQIIIIILSISLLLILFRILFFRLPQFGRLPNYKENENILNSENFYDGSFHNLDDIKLKMSFKKGLSLIPKLIKQEKGKRPPINAEIYNRQKLVTDKASANITRITWFGHSAIMIDIDGKRLLLDPMLSKYASPFQGFVKRFENSLQLSDEDISMLGNIDAVLFSHDHYDHLDYKTVLKIKENVSHFFVPLGVGSHLIKWGINKNRITELDLWQEVEFEGLKFVCTPSQHFSGRNPNYRNSSLWCSWAILGQSSKLFFSGDSGYSKTFKEIGEKFGPFNLTMMECGQYNELWKEVHMMPEQTVKAHIDLKGQYLLPIHNSAFSLAMHSWKDPIERVRLASEKENVKILCPKMGESFVLDL